MINPSIFILIERIVMGDALCLVEDKTPGHRKKLMSIVRPRRVQHLVLEDCASSVSCGKGSDNMNWRQKELVLTQQELDIDISHDVIVDSLSGAADGRGMMP